MEQSLQLLNKHNYSDYTLNRISQKQTEKGRMNELNTLRAFKERFPDSESVFQEIVSVMFAKSNNRCRCGALISKWYERVGKYKYRCRFCKDVFAPLARTPLRRTHLPLEETLELAFMMYQGKNLTAREATRLFGRKYETALNQCRRIRDWIGLTVGYYCFNPDFPIQLDEMFQRIPTGMGRGSGIKLSRGLGSERNKPVFVLGQPRGIYRAFAIDSVDKYTLKPIIDEHVPNQAFLFTDGKSVYHYIEKEKQTAIKNGDSNYRTLFQCNHSSKPKMWAHPETGANVNGVEAFNGRVKGKTGPIHRGVSEEHLQEYLDEISWMVSNGRKDSIAAIEQLFNALPPLFSITDKNIN